MVTDSGHVAKVDISLGRAPARTRVERGMPSLELLWLMEIPRSVWVEIVQVIIQTRIIILANECDIYSFLQLCYCSTSNYVLVVYNSRSRRT